MLSCLIHTAASASVCVYVAAVVVSLKALSIVRITGILLGRPAESCWLRVRQQRRSSTMAGHRTVAGGPVEHSTFLLYLEPELVSQMGCAQPSLKLRLVDKYLNL